MYLNLGKNPLKRADNNKIKNLDSLDAEIRKIVLRNILKSGRICKSSIFVGITKDNCNLHVGTERLHTAKFNKFVCNMYGYASVIYVCQASCDPYISLDLTQLKLACFIQIHHSLGFIPRTAYLKTK